MDLLNGLSVFTGIGGIDLALSGWVRPVAYCESDRYAQSVLISRMAEGKIPIAPIWDDIRTLTRKEIDLPIHAIYGGFPCQDISVAGIGDGLDGDRSILFFEILRLARELKPAFIFIENSPAIRTRGLDKILQEFTAAGYDCRWIMLSAGELGAPHLRRRWFLLAYSNSFRGWTKQIKIKKCQGKTNIINNGKKKHDPDSSVKRLQKWPSFKIRKERLPDKFERLCKEISDFAGQRLEGQWKDTISQQKKHSFLTNAAWWQSEPDVGRVVHGLPRRMDRIKCLGNAVVPVQARIAFERLIGI